MVTAVKHAPAKCVINDSPFYITTNEVPDFCREDENIKRRLQIFKTRSLVTVSTGIDRWIYDHAIDCVVWVANQVTDNRHLVASDELWYERERVEELTIRSNQGRMLFNSSTLRTISDAHLQEEDSSSSGAVSQQQVIDESFTIEHRCRRLARKRRAHRGDWASGDESNAEKSSSDDELDIPVIQRATTSDKPSGDEERSIGDSASQDSVTPCEHSARQQQPEQQYPPSEQRSHDDPSVSPSSGIVHEEENVEEDDGYDSHAMRRYDAGSAGWKLNDVKYLDKVASHIEWTLILQAERATSYSFRQRLSRAEQRKTKEAQDFCVSADPYIDA